MVLTRLDWRSLGHLAMRLAIWGLVKPCELKKFRTELGFLVDLMARVLAAEMAD